MTMNKECCEKCSNIDAHLGDFCRDKNCPCHQSASWEEGRLTGKEIADAQRVCFQLGQEAERARIRGEVEKLRMPYEVNYGMGADSFIAACNAALDAVLKVLEDK